MMTPEDKDQLSEKIVRLCHSAGSYGLPVDRIDRMLAAVAFRLTSGELGRELKYLASKGWIETVEKDLRPDLARWISTAAGDEFLMKRGLV